MAEAPRTLGAVFRELRKGLADAAVADPGLEARLLVEGLAGLSRSELVARPEQLLPDAAGNALAAAARRRAGGEPLHRILGWREFYGLRLELSPDTLEPRPDTETLVDAVLPFVRQTVEREGGCRILDLGTGSGAIALAILSQVAGSEAVGGDISEGALRTAGENARRLGLSDRFQTRRSDWFAQIAGRFSLIVSNPPYISREELAALPPAVSRFDPARALDGGADGLGAYRELAKRSPEYLEAGGILAVEIGSSKRDAVTELFRAEGFILREARRDYGGNDRVLAFSLREIAANP